MSFLDLEGCFPGGSFPSASWLIIMTAWVATRILSSNIEFISARLYNSSIVVGGSKDSDWKKGVDGPKLLLKFWRTTSMVYDSICWKACPNLFVKSRIVSSSCLRMDCKELMFIFFHTEQRYRDMNTKPSKCCLPAPAN